MTPFPFRLQYAVPLALAALFGACRNSLVPTDVGGVYALRSASGGVGPSETPVSGTLTLTPEGAAERRVSYRADTTGTLIQVVAIGTFRVVDSVVQFALRENSGQSPYVWRVTATLESDGALRWTYPRAADGTIVELYEQR